MASSSSATTTFRAVKSRLAARSPVRIEEPGAALSSVALILAAGASGLEALFIRRAVRRGDPWSGHIGLPGGRREPGDADRLATAVRETGEEIGVELRARELLGELDDLHPRAPTLPPISIRPFVFGRARRPRWRLSAEVADVLWIPLAELRAARDVATVPIRGVPTEVPCLAPRGVVVWGLTYRIVTGFLALV